MKDKDVLAALRQYHPDFWSEFDRADWLHLEEDGNVRMHRAFAAFSHFAVLKLGVGEFERAAEVFEFVERVVAHGSAHAAHAATTCFLETVMNHVPRQIAPEKVVPLLGAESRRFCRKWDAVTGFRTAGLWGA